MDFLVTRGQRSKLHAAMQEALGVPANSGFDSKYVRQEGFVEAVCWADSEGDTDHAEIFLLASHIESFIYAALWDAKEEYAQVDAEDLRGQYSSKTIGIALRCAGVRPKSLGSKTVWTTAPGDEAAFFVKLPFDLIR